MRDMTCVHIEFHRLPLTTVTPKLKTQQIEIKGNYSTFQQNSRASLMLFGDSPVLHTVQQSMCTRALPCFSKCRQTAGFALIDSHAQFLPHRRAAHALALSCYAEMITFFSVYCRKIAGMSYQLGSIVVLREYQRSCVCADNRALNQ